MRGWRRPRLKENDSKKHRVSIPLFWSWGKLVRRCYASPIIHQFLSQYDVFAIVLLIYFKLPCLLNFNLGWPCFYSSIRDLRKQKKKERDYGGYLSTQLLYCIFSWPIFLAHVNDEFSYYYTISDHKLRVFDWGELFIQVRISVTRAVLYAGNVSMFYHIIFFGHNSLIALVNFP